MVILRNINLLIHLDIILISFVVKKKKTNTIKIAIHYFVRNIQFLLIMKFNFIIIKANFRNTIIFIIIKFIIMIIIINISVNLIKFLMYIIIIIMTTTIIIKD